VQAATFFRSKNRKTKRGQITLSICERQLKWNGGDANKFTTRHLPFLPLFTSIAFDNYHYRKQEKKNVSRAKTAQNSKFAPFMLY